MSKMWSAALYVCVLCGDVVAVMEIFVDMCVSGFVLNVYSCIVFMCVYVSV